MTNGCYCSEFVVLTFAYPIRLVAHAVHAEPGVRIHWIKILIYFSISLN